LGRARFVTQANATIRGIVEAADPLQALR